jgi:hypothetical protein
LGFAFGKYSKTTAGGCIMTSETLTLKNTVPLIDSPSRRRVDSVWPICRYAMNMVDMQSGIWHVDLTYTRIVGQ